MRPKSARPPHITGGRPRSQRRGGPPLALSCPAVAASFWVIEAPSAPQELSSYMRYETRCIFPLVTSDEFAWQVNPPGASIGRRRAAGVAASHVWPGLHRSCAVAHEAVAPTAASWSPVPVCQWKPGHRRLESQFRVCLRPAIALWSDVLAPSWLLQASRQSHPDDLVCWKQSNRVFSLDCLRRDVGAATAARSDTRPGRAVAPMYAPPEG